MLDGVRRSFDRGVGLLSTDSRRVGLSQGNIRIRPSFSLQQGEFHSDAEDCFGLYAAAFAIRWCRNCVNFLTAARAAAALRLHSPAVLLSYASAFQTLHAHLALHGCVVIDPAHVEDSPSRENAKPAAIAGRLTKAGGWKFEKIHRAHSSRWKELQRVGGATTHPAAFQPLFSYFYRNRWKVRLTLDGLVAQWRDDRDAPRPIPWTMDEKMDEFLSEIAAVRHEAQYSGFGADSYAFDAMMNDEGGPYRLHLRSEAMMTFASSFATEVVRDLLALLEPIQHSEVARHGIQLLALFPVHDAPRTSEIVEDDLRTALDRLEGLLGRDAT